MVGRDAEEAAICEWMMDVQTHGTMRLVVIEGDTGSGKTRLAQFCLHVGRMHLAFMLHGYAEGARQFSPLHAWQPIFWTIFGVDQNTRPKPRHARVKAFMERFMPEVDPASYGLLNKVALTTFPLVKGEKGGRLGRLNQEEQARERLALLVKVIAAATTRDRHPSHLAIILIEGLHHADSASLKFLLLVRAANIPGLYLVTFYPTPSL